MAPAETGENRERIAAHLATDSLPNGANAHAENLLIPFFQPHATTDFCVSLL
jgi:hypothetical protein